MEYLISRNEITRRKWAYFTFSLNLVLGLILGSFALSFPLPLYIYLTTIVSFFLVGVFSFVFFTKLFQTKIYFDNNHLIKKVKSRTEKYLLSDINKVAIKWTRQKTIREVYIWLKDNNSVFVTALVDFIGFKNELLSRINKNVSVNDKHEPIKYDHPLFYVILGLFIGLASIFLFRSLIQANLQLIRIGSYIFLAYSMGLGLYFYIFKPTSKISGETTKKLDYIARTTLILLGVITCLFVTKFTYR